MRPHAAPTRLPIGLVALLGAVVALAPTPASGQSGSGCRFLEGTENLVSNTVPGAGTVTYVRRPRIGCDDGVRIQADSAVAYSAQNMSHLMGHVRYRDGSRDLRADEARYFTQVGRVQASGHVFVRDIDQGSTIENGDLVYLRRTAFRSQEQMTVTRGRDRLRPKALLHVQPGVDTLTVDSAQAASPSEPDTVPYQVEADRLFLQGDRYFSAGGDVVIERDSLVAHSDSAEYDQLSALMVLRGSARVDASTYDLAGRVVEMALPDGRMRSVHAVHEATLLGEDLDIRAPSIEIFVTDGAMERLVAIRLPPDSAATTPAGGAPPLPTDSLDLVRPVARAQDFQLTADSIEVRTPGQVLDRIFAAGTARGESSARDSLNVPELPEVARRDWMEGDTVIATFVRAPSVPGEPDDTLPADSARAGPASGDSARAGYQLERLVALGAARSLYRLLPADSTVRPGVDRPAVSYVTGRMITIVMNEGEVDRMEVIGPTEGWHLEPTGRAARDSLAAPDTAGVGPDTTRTGPDTTRVGPDTTRTDLVAGTGAPVGRAASGHASPANDRGRLGAGSPGALAARTEPTTRRERRRPR